MRRIIGRSTGSLVLALAALSLGACKGGAGAGEQDVQNNVFRDGLPPSVRDGEKLAISDGSVDYSMALRSAAIKLTGNYPTYAEIKELRDAADKPTVYAARIDAYLARPEFSREMISFWRNTFRMGNQETVGTAPAMMEFAPTYAAMLVVQGKPITDLVTAKTGTCPTYTAATNTFSTTSCPNNTAVLSGVLSDQGVQQQFTSAMAFRRARWVQETFACSKFPAERGGTPTTMYPNYVAPWPWLSITGKDNDPAAKIDFHAKTGDICANCHATLNHLAPLFGKFNGMGLFVAGNAFQVTTPVPMEPTTTLNDWLPAGETTAWRYMKPAADLPALGAAIAADPEFARCMSARVWNWAMSRGDIVNDGQTLTEGLANRLGTQLAADNFNMKVLIKNTFTDANFVRF